MIHLSHVKVRFADHLALDDFTASFPSAAITAIIGGDGAGKSTLLKVLAGRLKSDGIHPHEATALRFDKHQIGYQPADSGVWRELTVAENIEFATRVHRLDRYRARTRADSLLETAGLDQVRNRAAGRLSGGMRQKLGVVLATLHEPELVILDEPTTGVDPVSRAELWSLLSASAAEGATVVFATAYLDEAERASHVLLMAGGQLLAAGGPDEITTQMPGSLWRAPVHSSLAESPAATLPQLRPNSWRRGNTLYFWTPSSDSSTPPGYSATSPDLENASIALLLATESAAASSAGTADITGTLTDMRVDSTADSRALVFDDRKPSTPACSTTHPGSCARAAGEHPEQIESVPLTEATGVVKRFGDFTALKGVDLTVRAGEIVGLVGANGAGKTTLMRLIIGLDTADSGTCALFGATPSRLTRARLGYVAQGFGLYPSLNARENLEFAADVHGVSVDGEAIGYAGAAGNAPVSVLPLGTRRTLAYLCAIQHNPELLILDEPTSGMDTLTRARLWRRLHSLADGGKGVLVSTHYMAEAAQCDRLVLMADGNVIAQGSAEEVIRPHQSVKVETEQWADAFMLLRTSGFHVLMTGRSLRLPGAQPDEVQRALRPLGHPFTLSQGRATLDETMLLAAHMQN